MSVKAERISIVVTPEFKAFLTAEAKREGISISELVRKRCQMTAPSEDEVALQTLMRLASSATKRAITSLDAGLKDVDSVLAELRAFH